MSDKNPCPFCGDYSEYLRFLDLCAERANEIWRENEVKTLTDVYKAMDFVQVVRCRDCKEFAFGSDECATADWCDYWDAYVESPDGFCKWGEKGQS